MSASASNPAKWVISLIILQAVLWTAAPALTHISLPFDVVREGLAWGHEWQWGYHKHPPLVSWIAEASFVAFGDWGPFLASQLAIALTYWCVFRLGTELLDPERAAIGTLLLVGVFYFTLPTPEFNHNLAQMPIWAGALLCFQHALKRGDWRWWVGLGLAVGVGILTKYTIVVLVAVMLIYVATSANRRRAFATPGPYLAILVACVLVAPHVLWLLENDFLPFHYAQGRAGDTLGLLDRLARPVGFTAAQIADHVPMVLLLLLSGLLWFRRLDTPLPPEDAESRRFLLWLGIGPAVLTCLLAVTAGMGLRDMWGAPMWSLSGLIAVAYLTPNWRRMNRLRLLASVYTLVAVLGVGYGAQVMFGEERRGKPSRSGWPDREIAANLGEKWREALDCPLGIITGESWLAGLVALRSEGRPSVYLHANPVIAPWVTQQRLARQGTLAVWRVREDAAPPAEIAALDGLRIGGVESFAWPRLANADPLKVGWGIVAGTDCKQR